MIQPFSAQKVCRVRISPWNERSGRMWVGVSIAFEKIQGAASARTVSTRWGRVKEAVRNARPARGCLFRPVDPGLGVAYQGTNGRLLRAAGPGRHGPAVPAPRGGGGCRDVRSAAIAAPHKRGQGPVDYRRHRGPRRFTKALAASGRIVSAPRRGPAGGQRPNRAQSARASAAETRSAAKVEIGEGAVSVSASPPRPNSRPSRPPFAADQRHQHLLAEARPAARSARRRSRRPGRARAPAHRPRTRR